MSEIVAASTLKTNRLYLRPYSEEDAACFQQLIRQNSARLAPDFPGRVRLTQKPEEAMRLVKQFKSDWMLGQTFAFGIWLAGPQQYIGDISLKNLDYSVPKAEIGYYLDEQAQGQGLAEEALKAIIKFAFEGLHLQKLYIRTSLQNNRSYLLAEKCGFQREGLLRADFRDYDKNLIDLYYYGLTLQDYEK